MRAEPIVNGLREELDGEMLVVQLNIRSNKNEALLLELDAHFTPTFILFDDEGQELWRSVGSLDIERVRHLVKAQQNATNPNNHQNTGRNTTSITLLQ